MLVPRLKQEEQDITFLTKAWDSPTSLLGAPFLKLKVHTFLTPLEALISKLNLRKWAWINRDWRWQHGERLEEEESRGREAWMAIEDETKCFILFLILSISFFFFLFNLQFCHNLIGSPSHFVLLPLVHEYSKFNLNFKPQMLTLSTKDSIARN